MSESAAKAELDIELDEQETGYISPEDVQDAIGIIYDDLEAGDESKLDKSGGTLTGAVLLSGDPTLALHPATKQYVDALETTIASDLADYLPLAGGTLTGTLTLNADPMTDLEAATKTYVDDSVDALVDRLNDELPEGAIGTSLTLTGTLDVAGTVTLPTDTAIGSVSATELGYLDGVTSGIQTQFTGKASLSGATFTGDVTVSKANPVVGINATSGDSSLNIDRVAGSYGLVSLRSGTSKRFQFGVSNAAESSTATGSNFFVNSFDNNGDYLDTPLAINRAASEVDVANLYASGYAAIAGVLFTDNTTDASSSTTGALKTAGGLGVAKKLYVGTDLSVGGTATLSADPTTALQAATKQYVDVVRKPAFADAKRTANQSINDGVQTTITYNVENYDAGGSLTNGVYTTPSAGLYSVSCNATIAAGEGTNNIQLFIDGTLESFQTGVQTAVGGWVTLDWIGYIAATKTVEFKVTQATGAARNITYAHFSAIRLADNS